jgi:pimeloyl-ACP methyl ester carboxylesterase
VTVVGHSLGGHLASAFSRLFPELAANLFILF